jgi:hypothetical protein
MNSFEMLGAAPVTEGCSLAIDATTEVIDMSARLRGPVKIAFASIGIGLGSILSQWAQAAGASAKLVSTLSLAAIVVGIYLAYRAGADARRAWRPRPDAALLELAARAVDGVSRPGSWERQWLYQAIGDEWEDRLEPDRMRTGDNVRGAAALATIDGASSIGRKERLQEGRRAECIDHLRKEVKEVDVGLQLFFPIGRRLQVYLCVQWWPIRTTRVSDPSECKDEGTFIDA